VHDTGHVSLLATAARTVLREFYFLNPQTYPTVDREDLGGACGAASLLLCELYSRYEFTRQVTVQQYYNHIDPCGCHCWIRLNNHLFIDITATQFGGPRLYISENEPFQLSTFHYSNNLCGVGIFSTMVIPYVTIDVVYSEMIDVLCWPESELIHPDELRELANDVQDEYQYLLDNAYKSEVA
jgi:hypothetical protein